MKLSVLICTRNRAKPLDSTLHSFFKQQFGGDYHYEVIVIDNNSTDETRQVIERYAALHPGIVRYCSESRQGLTYARNKAIAEASGEIIVFTDDDVLIDESWLDEIHREFTSDPSLCLFGGRVLLAHDGLQRVSQQPSDERQTFVFPDGWTFPMGANMAFRREVFNRIGLFDVRLGAGRFFAGGDETDFFYRALKAGYRLLYAPNALVYHNHDRVNLEQACRLEYCYGKGCSAYLLKHALRGDTYAMRMVYWLIARLPGRWFRKDGEPNDILRRRRAQIRGIIFGLIAAPLVMWSRQTEQSR
ncbi:MAG: glycosyltransferase family 2 protein [Acidobacteria bacterium]|nr:glycosyltransferase family 2 protein [Acidobacteriota bacterium]